MDEKEIIFKDEESKKSKRSYILWMLNMYFLSSLFVALFVVAFVRGGFCKQGCGILIMGAGLSFFIVFILSCLATIGFSLTRHKEMNTFNKVVFVMAVLVALAGFKMFFYKQVD